jgi:hypothetical protein
LGDPVIAAEVSTRLRHTIFTHMKIHHTHKRIVEASAGAPGPPGGRESLLDILDFRTHRLALHVMCDRYHGADR